MTIVRALDSNGDWLFGKSLSDYIANQSAVAQTIKTNVSSFLGDCFFDLGSGINWFVFLAGSKNQLALQLAIASTILNTTNVTGLLQLSATLNPLTRGFNIAYQVNTTYSVVTGQFSFDLGGTNA
jgi:hypothetical protein